jgi:hypothetical protein
MIHDDLVKCPGNSVTTYVLHNTKVKPFVRHRRVKWAVNGALYSCVCVVITVGSYLTYDGSSESR